MRLAWLGRGLAVLIIVAGLGQAALLSWQRVSGTTQADLHALPDSGLEPAAAPAGLVWSAEANRRHAAVALNPPPAELYGPPEAQFAAALNGTRVLLQAPDKKYTVKLAAVRPGGFTALPPPLAGTPTSLTGATAPADPAELEAAARHAVEVRRGDTLFAILGRLGIGQAEAHAVVASLGDVFDPRKLRVGQTLEIATEPGEAGDRLASLKLSVDVERAVELVREGEAFRTESVVQPLAREPRTGRGAIEDSLFESGRAAGVPPEALMAFIRLFSWDVDFQRDIHPGSSFEVVYEALETETGESVGSGEVLYARLGLGGKELETFRFELPDGQVDYFDRNGKSARKFLMRTPVDGARLSSRFGMRRHPILGYSRMHKGVDFAAPTGTPVYAAGNGQITRVGRNGGYGNYVEIRHNGEYSTAYAHLSKFARGMRRGARVEQGQVIAYVGTTGRSTGPHLHYEIHREGKAIDPLSVKPTVVTGLSGQDLASFQAVVGTIDRVRRGLDRPATLVAHRAGDGRPPPRPDRDG